MKYAKPVKQSSDLRRMGRRRLSSDRMAARQICRRYGVSLSHARVIVDLQGYGGRDGS